MTSIDTNAIFPCTGCAVKSARKLTRDVGYDSISLEPEKTAEEKRLESSTISFQRQLTPEEEKRVLFLKNMLAQLLTMADGQPTDEQKARIKEIENELEKITGVKMQSRISDATNKMAGDKKEDDEEERDRQARGIDPKEAVHSRKPEKGSQAMNPGMQMLQRNALFANLKTMLDSSDISSIKT